MGTGYTRNDASNNIANGNVIDAADLDGEFDAIESAFGTSGHSHDGTSAEGGAITLVGPSQEFRGDGSSWYPKSDATYDLGKSTASFDVAYVESINLGGTGITASAAEINYSDGVTSAIQTQLNGKQAADSNIVSDANYVRTDQNFTNADHSKLNGIETGATADQSASEIRALVEAASDSNVFTNSDHTKLNSIETNAKDDQTITAGSGLSGGGTGNVTLNHADTSSVSNANNSGNTFIQDINFDTYGHVTSVGTGTVSVGNGTLTVQGTGALGGSGTFTANQSGNATISISHDDTSSQASVNGSGRTYIQDVTLDAYGHVTGLATATETVTNATHTGEVTGSGSLTIANNVVDEANLKVSNSPTNGYVLSAQSGNTGGLTWIEAGGAGAVGGGSDEVFFENGQTVTSNYTITNGKNAMSAGPITINSGITVTVGAGETWTVI